ncbi:hypothetical protein [Fusobacterium sp.]|nr:hypothetical protein [Fusobacterium sp.]MDU1909863.1 hypothetical protein [Fusobacterium sp.]
MADIIYEAAGKVLAKDKVEIIEKFVLNIKEIAIFTSIHDR